MTDSETLVDFVSPQPELGTAVLWYKHGIKRRGDALVAYIVHGGMRTCTLYLCTGRRVDAVRHVSDPKLKLNVEQREQGAWDYPDAYYEEMEYRDRLDKRLQMIEKSICQIETQLPKMKQQKKQGRRENPNANEALKQFHALRRQAEELGIDVDGMKKVDLEKAIAEKSSDAKTDPQPEAV